MSRTGPAIMVLGVSRGGTTLTAAALGAHPRIAMLDEDLGLAIVHVTGGKIPGVKLCVPNQIELERRWNPLFRLGLSNGTFRKSLFMNRVPLSRHAILDYDRLFEVRYVCVLRNPGSVIESIMARERRSAKVARYRWERAVAVFESLLERGRAPVLLRFEGLVQQPEETLRALSAALGLEYDPAMLAAPAANARYKTGAFDASRGEDRTDRAVVESLAPAAWRSYQRLLTLAV